MSLGDPFLTSVMARASVHRLIPAAAVIAALLAGVAVLLP